jgi:uncharacterized protein YbjT (DUF2867 family)
MLVTGATGNVGSHLVRQLRDRGIPVRAFVRDARRAPTPDVEIAVGDFGDRASVERALDGVERAFLACGNVPGQVDFETGFIDAAQAAGVRRLVKLSAASAAVDSPLLFPRWQGEIERHLAASGVPSVLIRPSSLMTNLLMSADAIRHTGRLFAPAGGARITMIHPRDVAAVAAVALAEDGHEGRTYEPTGPAAITYDDIARDLSDATGHTIEFVDVSDEAARQGMLESGLPPEIAEFLVRLFAALRDGIVSQTTDTVRTLTGRDPAPFAEFARERAEAFGALARSAR